MLIKVFNHCAINKVSFSYNSKNNMVVIYSTDYFVKRFCILNDIDYIEQIDSFKLLGVY